VCQLHPIIPLSFSTTTTTTFKGVQSNQKKKGGGTPFSFPFCHHKQISEVRLGIGNPLCKVPLIPLSVPLLFDTKLSSPSQESSWPVPQPHC
jgi:hypothetical protein